MILPNDLNGQWKILLGHISGQTIVLSRDDLLHTTMMRIADRIDAKSVRAYVPYTLICFMIIHVIITRCKNEIKITKS